jgi:hypothetical protein
MYARICGQSIVLPAPPKPAVREIVGPTRHCRRAEDKDDHLGWKPPLFPPPSRVEDLLALESNDMGVLSDAGCPGVADPGAALVAAAHRSNVRVVPLVGPSAILLALMASGMNPSSSPFTATSP